MVEYCMSEMALNVHIRNLHHQIMETFDINTDVMKKKPCRIYGVPRGGTIVCCILSATFKGLYNIVFDTNIADVIIDDIIVSGNTKRKFNTPYFLALIDEATHKGGYNGNWIVFPWEQGEKITDFQDSVIRQLEVIGEDPKREGLKDTPSRVEKMYKEIFSGYSVDSEKIKKLLTSFSTEGKKYDQMITCSDIDFFSTCEHHLVPFFGKIHISYIPTEKVLGISKLVRLAEVFSKRLQIQERLTEDIKNALNKHVPNQGVIVHIEAQHLCMKMRGVRNHSSIMKTTAFSGKFEEQKVREEFFNTIK